MTQETRASVLAGVVALLVGLALHYVTIYFRDHGPTWESARLSLRGNGAIVFLLPVPVAIWMGEVWCYRRKLVLGMVLVPVALLLGVCVIAGPV